MSFSAGKYYHNHALPCVARCRYIERIATAAKRRRVSRTISTLKDEIGLAYNCDIHNHQSTVPIAVDCDVPWYREVDINEAHLLCLGHLQMGNFPEKNDIHPAINAALENALNNMLRKWYALSTENSVCLFFFIFAFSLCEIWYCAFII